MAIQSDAQLIMSSIFDHTSDTTDVFVVGENLPGGPSTKGVNTFSLEVDHSSNFTDTIAYTIAVSFKLYEVPTIGSPSFFQTDTLSFHYDPFNDSTGYKDAEVLVIRGFRKFAVHIEKVWKNGVEQLTLPENIRMDMIFMSDAYETMDAEDEVEDVEIEPVTESCGEEEYDREFEVTWAAVDAALEYQLEWTFINDYDADYSAYKSFSDPSLIFDFRNNSSRVSTKNLFYRIPNLFDHGYLIVRVRAVGKDESVEDRYYTTAWTLPDSDVLSTSGTSSILIDSAHENSKNWQITTTFAEEGKKKEVISYFDGTLRNRQTVTRINSDGNVVVGETIYDYQGRPAVNILPVPVLTDGCTNEAPLRYYGNFNRVEGDPADASHFDPDTDECTVGAMVLDNTNGAALYYSASNPQQSGEQAFVPESNGYPYTQVQYMPDNTGRIARQSGVGEYFTIDSERATEYIYTSPKQVELDRLFGSEVGFASHYKKNIIIDPNGQSSVSYLDQEGRVIATALTGNAPANVSPLPEYAASTRTLTDDLLQEDALGNSAVNLMNTAGQIVLSTSFAIVENNTTVIMDYGLMHQQLEDDCFPEEVCVTCAYRLKITVMDECGNMVWAVGDGEEELIGNFDTDINGNTEFLISCPELSQPSFSDTLSLDKGTYYVTKTLTIDQEARTQYLQAYLSNLLNDCYIPFETFLDEQLGLIDESDCTITCASCLEALGDLETYILNGGTQEDYKLGKQECAALCETFNPCMEPYEMMLADLIPGGQYALYEVEQDEEEETDYFIFPGTPYKTSLLNPDNELPAQTDFEDELWRHPKLIEGTLEVMEYRSYDNVRTKIPLYVYDIEGVVYYMPEIVSEDYVFQDEETGDYFTYPEYLLKVEDFENMFEESWAKSLITYHPEYCYYKECIHIYYYEDEEEWTNARLDSLLEASFDFDLAIDNGFVTPTYVTFGGIDYLSSFTLNDWTDAPLDENDLRDVLIQHSSEFANFGDDLLDKWDNYVTIASTTYSMMETAALISRVGNNLGPGASVDPWMIDFGNAVTGYTNTQNDVLLRNEWSVLYNLYLSAKREIIFDYFEFVAMTCEECRCFNKCFGKANWSAYSAGCPLFVYTPGSPYTPGLYVYDGQPCSLFDKHLYESKQPRWIRANDIEAVAAGANASQNMLGYNLYASTGLCPIDFAFQNLLTELAAEGLLTTTSEIELQTMQTFAPYINAISDYSPDQMFSEYDWEWEASVSSGVLTAELNDISDNALLCELELDNLAASWSWDDVVEFRNLDDTGPGSGGYTFTIQAKVEISPGEFEWHTVNGFTDCANLGICTFENECEPNALAIQLFETINAVGALATNGLLSTSYTLATEIEDAIGITLGNILGSYTTLTYNLNQGADLITIATVPAGRTIRLHVQEKIPSTFTWSSITAGCYFANFRSEFENFWAVDIMKDGVLLVELRGFATLLTHPGTESLELGNCGSPQLLECIGPDFRMGEDIALWVMDLALNNITDPFSSVAITPQLADALAQQSTSFTRSVLTGGDITTKMYESEEGCTFTVTHPDIPDFDAANILDISDPIPLGDPNEDGYHYSFALDVTVIYYDNESVVQVIYGGCIPFGICPYPCEEEEEEESFALKETKSVSTYYEYIEALAAFNTGLGYVPEDSLYIHPLTYLQYNARASYFTAEQYIRKLKEFKTGIDSIGDLNCILKFSKNYGNYVNPKKERERYLKAVDKYNARAATDTLPPLTPVTDSLFFSGSLADSLDAYLNYLEFVSNPVAPPADLDDYYFLNIYSYEVPVECEEMYELYIDAYSIWEAAQNSVPTCETFVPGSKKPYSRESFLKMGFCEDELGYTLFENYIDALLVADGCVKPAPEKKEGNTEMMRMNIEDCQSFYNIYMGMTETYNLWYDGIFLPHDVPKFNKFVEYGYCDCVEAYIEYLAAFVEDENDLSETPALSIKEFDCDHLEPPLTDPCEEAYSEYLDAIDEFNNYIVMMDIRGVELEILVSYNKFMEMGLCDCLEEWMAFLQSLVVTKVTEFTEPQLHHFDIRNFCDNDPPCDPEISVIDDFADWPEAPYVNPCLEGLESQAYQNAVHLYELHLAELTLDFVNVYNSYCSAVDESFHYTTNDHEFHYTLYYYDQAGNLIKTVPPAGVRPLDIDGTGSDIEQALLNDRTFGTQTVFTSHALATHYTYNSLNQLVRQSLPDHDKMNISHVSVPQMLPDDLDVVDVKYVSESNAWLVGNRTIGAEEFGAVYKSSDGGLTWTIVHNVLGMDIQSIAWVDDDIAVAAGSFGNIIRTTDGGISWKQVDNHTLTYEKLNRVITAGTGHMYIFGNKEVVLYSDDDGETWTSVNPSGAPLTADENFTDASWTGTEIFVVGSFEMNGHPHSTIYEFTPGTTSWTRRGFKNHQWTGISPAAGGDFVLTDDDGGVFYLAFPSGLARIEALPSKTSAITRDAYFADRMHGVVIAGSAQSGYRLYQTENGGQQYTPIETNISQYSSLVPYKVDGSVTKHMALGGILSLTKVIGEDTWGQIGCGSPSETQALMAVAADTDAPGGMVPAVLTGSGSTYYTLNLDDDEIEWQGFDQVISMRQLAINRTTDYIRGMGVMSNGSLRYFYVDVTAESTSLTTVSGTATRLTMNQTDGVAYTTYKNTDTDLRISIWPLNANATTTPTDAETPFTIPAGMGNITGMEYASGRLVLVFSNGGVLSFSASSSSVGSMTDITKNVIPNRLNAVASGNSETVAAGTCGDIYHWDNTSSVFSRRKTKSTHDINRIVIKGSKVVTAMNNGKMASATISTGPAGFVFSPVYFSASEEDHLLDIAFSGNEFYTSSATGKVWKGSFNGSNIPGNLSLIANTGTAAPLNALAWRPSSSLIFIGGDNGRLISAAATTVTPVNEIYFKPLAGADFNAEGFACVVGENGMLRYSADAGANWSAGAPANVNQVSDLLDVAVSPSGSIKVVGALHLIGRLENGLIIKENSGTTGTISKITALKGADAEFIATGLNSSSALRMHYFNGSAWSDITIVPGIGTSLSGITAITSLKALDRPRHFSFTGVTSVPSSKLGIGWLEPDNDFGSKALTLTGVTDVADHAFIDDISFVTAGASGSLHRFRLDMDLAQVVDPYATATLSSGPGNSPLDIVTPAFNGQTNQSDFTIRCIAFRNAYEAFIGARYSDDSHASRLLFDMSGKFSTLFWYDRLGRIVVSRNTKQKNEGQYSYTLYDALGRVTEAGQKEENEGADPLFETIFGASVSGHWNPGVIDDSRLLAWIGAASGLRTQVTRTLYDQKAEDAFDLVQQPPLQQTHLRKRVSAVVYQEVYQPDITDYEMGTLAYEEAFTYNHATYYTYDIHGNVKTLVQDNPAMTLQENELAAMRFKRIDYSYDLISGNVHDVHYQDGQQDAWHHHYTYDGDNRITDVYTSSQAHPIAHLEDEGIGWDQDARYAYYDHGPLARMEIGENKVQGTDYAYTLQGWLKGVNGDGLDGAADMGGDGRDAHLHQYIARDAFHFSLGYYVGDYEQISSVAPEWPSVANGSLLVNRSDLWNGNIGYMVTQIAVPAGADLSSGTHITGKLGMSYAYDQLNRLVRAKASEHDAGTWINETNNAYYNAFTYDPNGNILTQQRRNQDGVMVDDLGYVYQESSPGGVLSNRLYHVTDASGNFTADGIGDMGAVTYDGTGLDLENNNYLYSEIGELKADKLEAIEEILWRVDGKISEVRFTALSGKDHLKFQYDAMGNRVAKYVMDGDGPAIQSITFYVRDAQGNVMAVYENTREEEESYHLSERHIYGSSRLGMETSPVEFHYIYADNAEEPLRENFDVPEENIYEFSHTLGNRRYELSNHLGNVLAVISDQKIPEVDNTLNILYYHPNVISSQDYSPFGVTLSGRNWSVEGKYRYGFQNQETVDEVSSTSYSFKLRNYNPSLGRFMSVDPLYSNYPYYSTYSFSANSVLVFIDIEGAEPGVAFPSITIFTNIEDANQVITRNWKAYKASSWADMKSDLRKHKEQDVNIELSHVYIQTHGNSKGIVIGPPLNDGGSDTNKQNGEFDITGDFGTVATSWDLNLYKEYMKRGDKKFKSWYKGLKFNQTDAKGNVEKRTYDSWADNEAQMIGQFLSVLEEIPDGGTVVLGGCDVGSDSKYLELLYDLSGRRLNIIANKSNTQVFNSILDRAMNACHSTEGWSTIGPSTGGIVKNITMDSSEGYIQLSSGGKDNIEIKSEPCPEN